jgi:uncharacterized membrane protein YozB (DUF420 family)
MQDTELFLSLAEIAGVFVGFGALISVRSGGPSDAHEVTYIRWVVSIAIWVVIAALAPVIISRYDITGHDLWMACSLVVLVLFAVMYTVNGRAPEHREDAAAILATAPRVLLMLGAGSTIWLPAASLVLALALVVLGLFPDQEQALYLTAVGLGLFMGAIGLFAMVFSQRRPAAPPDRAGLPATGGSSA